MTVGVKLFWIERGAAEGIRQEVTKLARGHRWAGRDSSLKKFHHLLGGVEEGGEITGDRRAVGDVWRWGEGMVVTPYLNALLPRALSSPAVGGSEGKSEVGKAIGQGVFLTKGPDNGEFWEGGGQVAGTGVEELESRFSDAISALHLSAHYLGVTHH